MRPLSQIEIVVEDSKTDPQEKVLSFKFPTFSISCGGKFEKKFEDFVNKKSPCVVSSAFGTDKFEIRQRKNSFTFKDEISNQIFTYEDKNFALRARLRAVIVEYVKIKYPQRDPEDQMKRFGYIDVPHWSEPEGNWEAESNYWEAEAKQV